MKKKKETSPLLCDTETGMCEITSNFDSTSEEKILTANKPIKIVYYTDPICSSCWGVEPQLRKLKLEYGHIIDIEYKMGGLLPDWSYNNGGISKPSDVATHWDEVSLHYDMPIDGDLWLEDPMSSSYPPSIAIKAAQMQSEEKAVLFLRQMRELMFLHKRNMTKWEHISEAAEGTGLDLIQLLKDYKGKASELFKEDLLMAKKMRVRGFPSFFFANKNEDSEFLYGARPYQDFEEKIKALFPKAVKKNFDTSKEYLFNKFKTLTVREFSELSGMDRHKSELFLDELYTQKWLNKLTIKNGSLYYKE